jgi:disulfide bond formation protein DsbB
MLSYETMRLFFAMLAVGANIVVVVYVATWVAARWSAGSAQLLERFNGYLAGYELLFGAIAAGTATLGSLYLSESVGLIPCTDCWYQRIAMYPIAVILSIAAWRRDTGVRIYVNTIAIIGGLVAVYHYLIQWFPNLEGTSCTTSVPCTGVWFREFGFISIPYMALSTFTLVLVMMMALRANTADAEQETME